MSKSGLNRKIQYQRANLRKELYRQISDYEIFDIEAYVAKRHPYQKKAKKNMQKEFMKPCKVFQKVLDLEAGTICWGTLGPFDTFQTTSVPAQSPAKVVSPKSGLAWKNCDLVIMDDVAAQNNTMETTMRFYTDDVISTQRNYVLTRLSDIYGNKNNELRRQFGMLDDPMPTTMNELVARIKAGKYIIPEKYGDVFSYNVSENITWRDPSVKEDRAGFEAANKKLYDAWQVAKDQAVLGELSAAQTALDTFQNWALQ